MPRQFEYQGQVFEVPDDVTDDEVLSLVSEGGAAPSQKSDLRHKAEATVARPLMEGVVGGVTTPLAMAGDLIGGLAHRVENTIKYGKEGKKYDKPWFDRPNSMTAKAAAINTAAPDALGLDEAQTPGERLAAAGVSGMAGFAMPGGLGALMARGAGAGARVGSVLAANPTAQTVGGTAAGLAGQGVQEAGLNDENGLIAGGASILAGGLVPAVAARVGRMSINTPEGQRAIAGQIYRESAANPTAAAESAATVQDRIRTPGYQIRGTSATQDPGVARLDNVLNEWAGKYEGGGIARMAENNNTILSRGLDERGAVVNTARRTRAVANTADKTALERMDLRNQEEVDITDLLQDLRHNADPSASFSGPITADAYHEIADMVQNSARAIKDAEGNVTGHVIHPERLHEVRKALNVHRYSDPHTANNPTSNALRFGRKETQPAMEELASRIDDALGRPAYSGMLARSAPLRAEADKQEFMEQFAKRVQRGGERYPSGARVIDPGAWLTQVEKREDVPLPRAKKNMSIDTLDPERQEFIRNAKEDINAGKYADIAKRAGIDNSATSANIDLKADVERYVNNARSPFSKYVADPIINVLGSGATAAGVGTGNVGLIPVLRSLKSGGERIRARGAEQAQEGVQRALARGQMRPEEMAAMMRLDPFYNPGLRMTGVHRALQGTVGATGGFLASERESRYR